MGKNTLQEIGKILLVSFISIIMSVMATRRLLIDKKLDKVEYYRDKEYHTKEHEQLKQIIRDGNKDITNHFDTRIDDLKDYIKK